MNSFKLNFKHFKFKRFCAFIIALNVAVIAPISFNVKYVSEVKQVEAFAPLGLVVAPEVASGILTILGFAGAGVTASGAVPLVNDFCDWAVQKGIDVASFVGNGVVNVTTDLYNNVKSYVNTKFKDTITIEGKTSVSYGGIPVVLAPNMVMADGYLLQNAQDGIYNISFSAPVVCDEGGSYGFKFRGKVGSSSIAVGSNNSVDHASSFLLSFYTKFKVVQNKVISFTKYDGTWVDLGNYPVTLPLDRFYFTFDNVNPTTVGKFYVTKSADLLVDTDYVYTPDKAVNPDTYKDKQVAIPPVSDLFTGDGVLNIPSDVVLNPDGVVEGDYSGVGDITKPGEGEGTIEGEGTWVDTVKDFIKDFFDLTKPVNVEPLLLVADEFTDKFPFSLPWDLYNSLVDFNADGVAPVFDIPLNLPFYSDVITLDLGKFEKLAVVVRFFTFGGFVVSLIYVTRRVIQW